MGTKFTLVGSSESLRKSETGFTRLSGLGFRLKIGLILSTFSCFDSRAPACSPLPERLYGLPGGVPARRVPGFVINFVCAEVCPHW